MVTGITHMLVALFLGSIMWVGVTGITHRHTGYFRLAGIKLGTFLALVGVIIRLVLGGLVGEDLDMLVALFLGITHRHTGYFRLVGIKLGSFLALVGVIRLALGGLVEALDMLVALFLGSIRLVGVTSITHRLVALFLGNFRRSHVDC